MPFSKWKIKIFSFTLSCRIDLCLIIIFITNFKKPQKNSCNKISRLISVKSKWNRHFHSSHNGTEIFIQDSLFTCLRVESKSFETIDMYTRIPVFAERGRKRPPPLTRVYPHTTKRGVSVCPYFLASISCWRLLS